MLELLGVSPETQKKDGCPNLLYSPREQMVYSIKMVEPSLVLLDEERAEILGPFTHVKETGLPPVSMTHKTYTFG